MPGFSITTPCAACGTKNRIASEHLADTGRCGACKKTLPPLAEPLDADERAFDEILRTSKVPVLVDFWAEWCGPCRMAAPEVKRLAKEMAGRAIILKLNTEQHPNVAARYRVQSIPNFIVFRNARPVRQQAGVASSQEMRQWIETS